MLKQMHATVLLIALLSAGGCSTSPTLGKQSRANSLDTSVEAYRKLIRWGYYDEAAKYLLKSDGVAAPANLDQMARYRVTSYEFGSKLLADTGKEARVIAAIEYYEIDRGVISTLRDEQLWWFDDGSKHWYLSYGLPAFGAKSSRPPSVIH